jgi:DNA-binding transcriptional LysR family regulator
VPWVAGRQGSFCHTVVLHVCRTAGFEPAITHFTNDFATAYGLVAIGAGFALVPDLAGPPPEGVAIVPTTQPVPSRRIFAAVRSGSSARPAVAAALEALDPLPREPG